MFFYCKLCVVVLAIEMLTLALEPEQAMLHL